jgi:hypothetical protein
METEPNKILIRFSDGAGDPTPVSECEDCDHTVGFLCRKHGSEQFYDNEIAPALFDIMKKCEAQGMPFLAMVEFYPGDTGRTEFKPGWEENAGEVDGRSAKMRMTSYAARCDGNFDRFAMAMLKDAEKHGHGSIYLDIWQQWHKRLSNI